MKNLVPGVGRLPLHTFFFATYTGLTLYVNNAAFISFGETVPYFVTSIVIGLFGLFLFRYIFGNIQKAALFCSLTFILLYSYADLHYSLPEVIKRHSFLLVALLLALIASYAGLSRLSSKSAIAFNTLLNLSTGLVFCIQLFQLPPFYSAQQNEPVAATKETTNEQIAQNLPDIYYLILDGYGRADVLNKAYNFSNHDFIASLKEIGFFVANSSTSNYCRTALSIPSSLNFNYIQRLVKEDDDADVAAYQRMSYLMDNAQIFNVLEGHGYQIRLFASGYSIIDNNKYLPQTADSDFNYLVASKTPLVLVEQNPFLYKLLYGLRLKLYSSPYEKHRRRILKVLDQLPAVAQTGSKPKFVFADILAGHPPFVFDEHGTAVEAKREYSLTDGDMFMASRSASKEEYISNYRAQIKYINKRLIETIVAVLKLSSRPVVFIIQGDHGPGANFSEEDLHQTDLPERFSILNAIYFSDADTTMLQHNQTPVNTFRIVLNKYFRQDLSLLENRNYYSPLSAICDFTDVTNKLQTKE